MTPDIDVELRQQDLVRLAMAFASSAEWLALRLSLPVRVLALVGLVSSAWLSYWLTRAVELTFGWSALALMALSLPAFLLALAYWLLRRVIGLPRRIAALAESLFGMGEATWRDARSGFPGLSNGTWRSRLRELWRMGWALRRLAKAPGDATRLAAATGRAVVVLHPGFLLGTAVAALAAGLLAGLAMLSLLF